METRAKGGVYVPPFKQKRLDAAAGKDKGSELYQRLHWDALRKSIHGLVNKVACPSG
jgi:pre-mRNA-splicing factor CWC22